MAYEPSRGGVRGGKDQFDWDDVKVDKYRENYLAHSLMAPVGRWQKGKDLTWYTKQSISARDKDALKKEMAAIKKAEEEAMAIALGLKTASSIKSGSTLSKQEIAEVCKRRDSEDGDFGVEEHIPGVGFKSRRTSFGGAGPSVSKDGVTTFEHDPTHQQSTDRLVLHSRPSTDRRISKDDSTAGPDKAPQKLAEQSKKKHKKEKKNKKKKSRDRTKWDSDSDSGDKRVKKQNKEERHSVQMKHHKRYRHDNSGSEEYSGSKRQRHDSYSSDSGKDYRYEQHRRGAERRDKQRRRHYSDSDEGTRSRRRDGDDKKGRRQEYDRSYKASKKRRHVSDSEEEERTFSRGSREHKHYHPSDKDRSRSSYRH